MSVSVISKPVSAFWKLPYPLLPQRAGLSAVQLTATTAAGIDNPVGTMNQTACICPRYLVVGGENTDDFFLYALALLITQNLASNPNASITHDVRRTMLFPTLFHSVYSHCRFRWRSLSAQTTFRSLFWSICASMLPSLTDTLSNCLIPQI